jgi:hypothetical protein
MRVLRSAVGILLLVASLMGGAYGVRVTFAQMLYHRAKFGAPPRSVASSAELCRRAAALYPWNYRFPTGVAQQAWDRRRDDMDYVIPDRIDLAREFCAAAIALNPFKGDMRLLEARLIAFDSPSRAVACWEKYVDWHYWSAFNQAMLVKFRAAAGDFAGALRALDLLRGRPWHAHAERALRRAWEAERLPPGEG